MILLLRKHVMKIVLIVHSIVPSTLLFLSSFKIHRPMLRASVISLGKFKTAFMMLIVVETVQN